MCVCMYVCINKERITDKSGSSLSVRTESKWKIEWQIIRNHQTYVTRTGMFPSINELQKSRQKKEQLHRKGDTFTKVRKV